jgi:two-component system, cell cycle response regulator CtrA
MRVLLVQGSLAASFVRTTNLKSAGYVVDKVLDAEEAFDCIGVYEYDIVVLDRMPVASDGCRIIHQMRSRRIDTPMLMLIARDQGAIAVTALRAGADDVLAMPISDEELLARIEAIVRRRNGHAQSTLQAGSITIDMNSHEVLVAGRPMHLSNKEFAVLQLMALRRGMVVTKEKVLNFLYDGRNDPQTRTIEVFICYLRKKLAQFGADVSIDTVRGVGYILRAEAVRQTAPAFEHATGRAAPIANDREFIPAMAA